MNGRIIIVLVYELANTARLPYKWRFFDVVWTMFNYNQWRDWIPFHNFGCERRFGRNDECRILICSGIIVNLTRTVLTVLKSHTVSGFGNTKEYNCSEHY